MRRMVVISPSATLMSVVWLQEAADGSLYVLKRDRVRLKEYATSPSGGMSVPATVLAWVTAVRLHDTEVWAIQRINGPFRCPDQCVELAL